MAENAENLVLEQLRLLRGEMAEMRSDVSKRFDRVEERLEDVEAGIGGVKGVVFGLGLYMNTLDHRVEAIEKKLGGE